MSQIRVLLESPVGKNTIQVPGDVYVEQLIGGLLSELSLPRADKEVTVYRLLWQDGDRYLDGTETLQSAGAK